MTVRPSNTAGDSFISFPTSEIEQSIPERFDQQVMRYPDRLAVKGQGRAFSYSRLDATSNRIARRFSLRRHLYNMSSMPLGKAVAYLVGRFKGLVKFVLTMLWRRIALLAGHRQTSNTLLPRFRPDSTTMSLVAEDRYRVRQYDGSMVLVCIGSRKDQAGRKAIAKKGAEIIELPLVEGTPPFMHLTDEPYLSSLVEELELRLSPR